MIAPQSKLVTRELNLLAISDVVVQTIYSPNIRQRFADVDMVISCGDLPYHYQEYILSVLDVPLCYVRGNHDREEYGENGYRSEPVGGIDLHRRVVRERGLLLAGVEGSLRYREGPNQYSQSEMWWHVFSLLPGMMQNKLHYGRYLDIFVTHAPPLGVHDKPDLTHRGIQAFRWLVDVFQPALHLHGHIHVYSPSERVETVIGRTRVINTYGYKKIRLFDPASGLLAPSVTPPGG